MFMKRQSKPSLGELKKVGIWVRVSTDIQVKDESPEHHERRARYYAESKGWHVATVFNLDAVSGKSVMGHPETERMLEDIRAGRITGLIFSKLARLARNTRELLEFADIFQECGADLISLQESIDTSTPAGRLFYTMIAAMAQWEREEIASRVAASVPIRAKMGKPLGGAAPFGYRWEGQELVSDPKEAPIRRRLYELFAEHRRKKTVARMLNEEGFRTRNGSKFSDTTVHRLIQDTTAKGVRRANYTRSLGEGKAWELKPESEWVLSSVEPIVSEELWNECNALLKRGQGTRPVARRAVHLFGGRTFCHCGGKMQVRSDSPKYFCLQCKNRIPCDDLEAIFREQLREFFFSPDDIAEALEESDSKVSELKELLATVEGERATVQAEMDKVYKLYLADQVSVDGFGRTYKPLEERLKGLEDQIPKLQAELDFLRIQALSRDELIANAQSLFDRWADLLAEEKLQIVESVVERIVIGNGEVAIDLSYSPSGSRNSRNMATRPQGFIAATRTNRAGKTTDRKARETVIRPSSIGWRNASSTRRSNSGISSRNSTP
jgi:site-specific DNA recombinase